MRKLWLIVKHEYIRRVTEKSFLFSVLGIPLLIVGIGGISILIALGGGDDRPIGYVDHAAVLNSDVLSSLVEEQPRFGQMRAYPDEPSARSALQRGEIQAFYVVPEDYVSAKRVSVYYLEEGPGDRVSEDFEDFLRASLVARQPEGVQAVLSEGFNLVVRSVDGRREVTESNVLSFLLPFIVSFFLFFAISTAGGYLLQAVTEEKENRVVEVMATSVSPAQLMGGKALGLMGVSLTQILVWLLVLGLGVVVAGRFFPPLAGIQIPWAMLGITALYFLPTYVLIAGVMTSIGAAVTELQQGQQISGIINMLFVLPIFFLTLVFTNPDSPVLVALTLFPTTSFLTILLRWSLASVPLWQMVVSWTLLAGAALTSVWLAGRVFRMGMLRYGQRLRIGGIIKGLRERRSALEKETMSHA
ncbi:MAG: ABC transporter permease [Anaerolineae bacterium]